MDDFQKAYNDSYDAWDLFDSSTYWNKQKSKSKLKQLFRKQARKRLKQELQNEINKGT